MQVIFTDRVGAEQSFFVLYKSQKIITRLADAYQYLQHDNKKFIPSAAITECVDLNQSPPWNGSKYFVFPAG